MFRVPIRPAAVAVIAAGLVAAAPGVAHADICRNAVGPAIHFGPGGCINPAWRNNDNGPGIGASGAGAGVGPLPSGYKTWPPSGASTWPPTG